MTPPPPTTPTHRTARRRIALAALVVLLAAGGYGRYVTTRPDARLRRGDAAVRARDWDSVVALADKLETTGHPDHANALRGDALLARGQPEPALAVLNRVSPESKLRARAAVAAGKCLLELKQFREAYRVFAVVADENPNNADAHRGLAAAAYDMGQLSIAGTHMHRVAELDPADPRPHRLIGLIHKDLSHWDRSEAAYRVALARGLPDGVRGEVRVELATVLIQQGKYADAQAVLREEPVRDNPDWFAADAEALRGLGKRQVAADLVDKVLPQFPTPRLLKLRGQLFLDDTKPADAVPPLERAVKQSPTDYEARYLLGQCYAAVGRKDDAARELQKVEELKKDFTLLTDLSREAMEKPWDAPVRLQLAGVCDPLDKPHLAAMWRAAAGQGR